MDAEQLHRLVHRDPLAAWPHVVALIETGHHADEQLRLLEDLVYSDQLAELIDGIEEQARRSKHFRLALLTCGDALGGRGGPEMDRIFKVIADAEAELATVIELDREREIRSPHAANASLRAALHGKILIYRRRRSNDS